MTIYNTKSTSNKRQTYKRWRSFIMCSNTMQCNTIQYNNITISLSLLTSFRFSLDINSRSIRHWRYSFESSLHLWCASFASFRHAMYFSTKGLHSASWSSGNIPRCGGRTYCFDVLKFIDDMVTVTMMMNDDDGEWCWCWCWCWGIIMRDNNDGRGMVVIS